MPPSPPSPIFIVLFVFLYALPWVYLSSGNALFEESWCWIFSKQLPVRVPPQAAVPKCMVVDIYQQVMKSNSIKYYPQIFAPLFLRYCACAGIYTNRITSSHRDILVKCLRYSWIYYFLLPCTLAKTLGLESHQCNMNFSSYIT